MFGKYTIAELGALLSDPSRVEILTHLLDGSRHSAGALAAAAGLSPQAASAHLTKLTRGGLLETTRHGRTRLFELSRPEIGHMLEALGAATQAKPQGGHGRASHEAVRLARTCYDHLAGQLAILLTRAWVDQGWIARIRASRAVRISEEGRRAFRELLGFEIPRGAS